MRKILLFLSFVIVLCSNASAQNAILKIKIKDSENLNLPGASLKLSPGNNFAISNQAGEAIITGLNEGSYVFTISYIGYETITSSVNVKPGVNDITQTLQYRSGAGDTAYVVGDRIKGQARALNQQKNNPNITNIISADQIGRFPDANIGDAIKRVPGITMQNDQGEARNIIIRGMGPELNSVSLNGERIPSAEGDNRRIQMDLIPSDMIQTVEVNKTLTPEMDADAIGGSVNLVTRTPTNGLRLSGTLAGGYNPIRDGFIGTANFVVGNRFAKNKVGYVVSGSFNSNDFGSDNVEALWAKDANGKLYVSEQDIRIYDVKRIRRATTATFDFKIDPRNTIYLTGSYAWRDDKENRFRLRHRSRGNDANLIYDASGEITGYTNGEVVRQTKGGLDNGRIEARRLEDQRVRTAGIRGEHIWGKLKTDWNFQYARASENRPHERYIAMGRRNITVNQNISDPENPILTNTRPLTDYTRFNELSEQFQDQYEEDLNGRLNFELPVTLVKNQTGAFRFGARYRGKTKVRNNTFFSYDPQNTPANIAQLPLEDKTDPNFLAGPRYVAGQFVDPVYLGGLALKNSAMFGENDEPAEYLAGNYNAAENISAGFVQLTQNFSSRLSAIIGIRVENTSINYTGNIVEDEDNLKGSAQFKNSYTNLLPGINFRYAGDNDLILRAALTSALARPKYYDLVPYFNVDPANQELSSGNPSLEPIKSYNADLMAERYFKSVGLVSGGLFYKRLSNFFYTYRDDNFNTQKFAGEFPGVTNPIAAGDRWEFTQRRNGSNVNVYGLEVAFQRQLNFLPGFWKGFGIYTNYTFTQSRAKGIFDGSGQLIRSDVTLPGTAPHMFNASLSYENSKLVVRLSGNYTAAYVDDSNDAGYNEDAFFDRYYDKQFFLDANASYAFTKTLRVFAEANNLTNQPLRYYQGVKERTAQLEYYGPRYNMGIKFDLVR